MQTSAMGMIVAIVVLVTVIIIVACFIAKSMLLPKKISSVKKLIKAGKHQAAQRVAKGILAKNGKDFEAHYWLGEAYVADNKPELAFMEYKTVNENAVFNKTIPELPFRKKMAELYVKFNQPAEALKEYLLLTKMDGHNSDHFYNAGKLYEATNQPSPAVGFYQKAIMLDKRNSKAHAALGYLLLRAKQYAEAKKEIDTAIKLDPERYENYYYQGKILKENKEYSAAIKSFEKAQRDPEMRQRALIERGSCYMIAEQTDNAIAEFDHAIKCAKNEASQETLYARYFLAACYEKTRHLEKAIEQWNLISQRNKKFRDVPAKLNQYKDVQTNDSMKEYLTASTPQFMELCKKAALVAYGLSSQKVDPTNFGCVMLATENKDEFLNVRKQIFYVEFHRDSHAIEESTVRKIADTLKDKNYYKAIVFSSSGFTIEAINFAENRPVVLVGKELIENILTRAGV